MFSALRSFLQIKFNNAKITTTNRKIDFFKLFSLIVNNFVKDNGEIEVAPSKAENM